VRRIEICPPCADEVEGALPRAATAEFLSECELLEASSDEPRREGPRQDQIRVLLSGWGPDAACAFFGVIKDDDGEDVVLFVKIIAGAKDGLQPGDYAEARARLARCKRSR
jgi:hypothetical protein